MFFSVDLEVSDIANIQTTWNVKTSKREKIELKVL